MPSATVLPQGPAMDDIHQLPPACSQSTTPIGKLLAFWEAAQINNRGKYSTARMKALHDYCQRTSLARTLAVCVLTPIPALAVLLLAECLPLSDPVDGWRANYSVWLRIFIVMITSAAGSIVQIRGMASELSLTWRSVVGIAVGTASGATLVNLLCAALVVFPLPFGLIVTTIPFQMFLLLFFQLATRDQDFTRIRKAVKAAVLLILVQSMLAFVYTAFSTVFEFCTPTQQTTLILLLSVIKAGMKNLVAWLSTQNEDAIPVVVVFTAELFNALYVSICMQLAVSGWTSAMVIALDATQAVFSLIEIVYATKAIRTAQCKQPGHVQSILSFVLRKRRRQSESPGISDLNKSNSPRGITRQASATFSMNQVASRPAQVSCLKQSAAHNEAKVMCETRKLMFHSEYLMLVEYVECAIPALYAVYLIALAHLPSAEYYPHARSLTSEKLASTVQDLILYATLESLALVGLHVILKQWFGFSPLHQLAFVLETNIEQVQGRMFVWIIALPQLTLVHFGRWIKV